MFGIYGLNIEKNQDQIHVPGLLRYISPDKQHRINAFEDRRDAQRVLIGDLLIRAIACRYLDVKNSDLQFQTNEYGKPYLRGVKHCCFNLSHCGRWVVCAVDNKPVGVDIEEIVPIELDIARNYFSTEEIAYIINKAEVEQTAAFYDIWTLKESYIKALGCGLSKDLNSFTVKIIHDGKAIVRELLGDSLLFLRQYEIDEEYRLSLCAFNSDFPNRIQIVDMKWILDAFV